MAEVCQESRENKFQSWSLQALGDSSADDGELNEKYGEVGAACNSYEEAGLRWELVWDVEVVVVVISCEGKVCYVQSQEAVSADALQTRTPQIIAATQRQSSIDLS